jgi:2-polyprenyl-3-methyl-5-hydroxy-6-metoxy-1,4-benzoquinol methylase
MMDDHADHTDRVRKLFQDTAVYLGKDHQAEVRRILLGEQIRIPGDARILDVGCGDGRVSLQFLSEGTRVVLMDISESMLDKARQRIQAPLRANVELRNEDILETRLEGKFDLIVCLGLLAHVTSAETVIRRVASLLTHNGQCVFQITDDDHPVGRLLYTYSAGRTENDNPDSYLLTRIGRAKLYAICAEAGLYPRTVLRHWSVLPGLSLLPNAVLKRYQLLTGRFTFLSKMGSELIVLFEKRPTKDLGIQ